MELNFVDAISKQLNISEHSVEATIKLLDEGATIPFISRYRKEATGALDEVAVHNISQLYEQLKELLKRKEYIFKIVSEQGKMTDDFEERLKASLDPVEIEDLYMPFKPKRNTRAQAARQRGLEPLARKIMQQMLTDVQRVARQYVNENVSNVEDALAGANDIIAEWISENEKVRTSIRNRYFRYGVISSKVIKGKEDDAAKYRSYFNYSQPLSRCSSHQFLAIRRAENENLLKVALSIDDEKAISQIVNMVVKKSATHETRDIIVAAIKDSYRRLLQPSIENDVFSKTKEKADATAIEMFAGNLRQLLFSPPLFGKNVMAIDPGFRTGCKVVCLDAQGNLLQHTVIYPTAPNNDYAGASRTAIRLVKRHHIEAVALGNGTASRETERFLKSLSFENKVDIHVVSEQGASIYSASDVARDEFPDEDVTVRGAVSIGRRLIDPLAELVKIDPKSIGVGQYQHDVDQSKLKVALDFVVESCVNQVGVNVNTASPHLLAYVAGIGKQIARNIVAYRTQNGNFTSREQLKNVPRLGEKAFAQCAGFLRIPDAENLLDNTAVHPESYAVVDNIVADLNLSLSQLVSNKELLSSIDLSRYVTESVGLPTLNDILSELEKPGRDPRTSINAVEFDEQIREIEDIKSGDILNGIVTNITAFGAFVDIGIKENGLIHVSEISDRRVSTPADVVRINQQVRVKVLSVDLDRRRVALSMKGIEQSLERK